MPTYTKAQGGHSILAELKADMAKLNGAIAGVASRDDLPAEYRRRIRTESIKETQRLAADASNAFAEWAAAASADARKRYHSDPVASAADETRRLRLEMQTTRLIEAARLSDERTGPRVLTGGGRPVASPSAHDLAAKAEEAWLDGRYDDAQMYATASTTLGGPPRAAEVHRLAQTQLDLDSATRRQAMKDLAEVAAGERAFARDANAALAQALQNAAAAAKAIGDDEREYLKAANGPSRVAKMAAYADSLSTGEAYASPEGVMAEAPGSALRPTVEEYDRAVSRVDRLA